MLTAGLALAVLLLLVAVGAVCLLWRAAALEVIRLAVQAAGYRAELDALSITGPPVDTRTGSHDALPIRDDIRATLTAYCEGMWQHTQEQP